MYKQHRAEERSFPFSLGLRATALFVFAPAAFDWLNAPDPGDKKVRAEIIGKQAGLWLSRTRVLLPSVIQACINKED